METGLDNANNPFSLSNGASNDIDNVITTQKGDGLMLNLTDNFKQNGSNLSPTDLFRTEKSNGKRSASEFEDEDDFGPETNVDMVDDVLSPTSNEYEESIFKDKGFEGHYNPFMEHQEKAVFETEKIIKKKEEGDYENNLNDEKEFDQTTKVYAETTEKEEFHTEFQQQLEDTQRLAREETPTPPADTVHDVSGLVDNAGESESEDEWNYIKGEVANKENIPPQPEKEVAEIPEEDDSMSQLNPNAAEFVPVSPTRSVPSPLCRILNDEVIAQSPSRAQDIDINLPNPTEFEIEVKSRPSDVDSFNGHGEDLNKSSDLIDNLLNGKNIDDIPEFQPGSTPKKVLPTEEFHFGPNAVQFTPAKLLDQSEAGLSTKAVYGDESVATIGTSFNDSVAPEITLLNKESDPMSMSFYEDRDKNVFDLNTVQVIPDNIEEYLKQPDVNNSCLNETISDLPEHHPLGAPENLEVTLNNDDAIQVTDLDKQSYDDEKELASPLEPEKELLGGEGSEQSKTPEPTHENLLGSDFCCVPKHEKNVFADYEQFISPESELVSGVATEVADLLKTENLNLPPDVEMIPPELSSEVVSENLIEAKSPTFNKEESDLICEKSVSKSPDMENMGATSPALVHESQEPDFEVSDMLESKSPVYDRPELKSTFGDSVETQSPVFERPVSLYPVFGMSESKSPAFELPQSISPLCERPEAKSPISEGSVSKSPIGDATESKSPVSDRPESKSPFYGRPESKSPVCDSPISKLLVCERPESKSPIYDRPESQSSVCEVPEFPLRICDLPESKSPIGENELFNRPLSASPVCERFGTKSPICEQDLVSPVCSLPGSKEVFESSDIPKSPIPNETGALSPSFTSSQKLEEAQMEFEALCRPHEKIESPQEDVTSSIKDDVSPSPDELIGEPQEFESVRESNLQLSADVNTLINTSIVPSEVEEILHKQDISDLHVLQNSALPVQTEGEEIDIKTDKITPEFAEQAIITPSEESKHEEIASLIIEDLAKETNDKPPRDETVSAAILGITAASAITSAVAAATVTTPFETKVGDKKKTATTSATKKTTPKASSASKSTTPKPSPGSTPTSRSVAPKPAASKLGAAKPLTSISSSRPTSASTKLLARPKIPAPAASKLTEKKPLANGDVKPAVKSTMTVKKETTVTKTQATKLASSANKLSPTKPTTLKVSPSPKPATRTAPAKPFTAKPAPTSTRITSSASTAKRPTSLTTNKSPAFGSSPPKTTNSSLGTTAKPSLTKISPRVPTAPKPKSTTTTAAPKPRMPLSKTAAKAPDTEKQNKESANKITASRSATGTVTHKTAVGATRMVASSTIRRVESKTSAASRTIVSKTTTTTAKSTTGKKPAEIIRNASTKTKTTKIEKPKENGESTIVTEELTVVHTTNNSIAVDGDPQLLKDNSPLDNKLIIDSFVETNAMVD